MYFLITGAVLVIFSWVLAWVHTFFLSPYYFPFLWLGFILFVNGLSQVLHQDSLIKKMRWWFLLLFLFSIPLWWFFEYLNTFVQNWHYAFPNQWSSTTAVALKTISFATVIPSVYPVAYLLEHFLILKNRHHVQFHSRTITAKHSTAIVLIGIVMLLLVIAYPKVFFPFVWVAPLLIIDPFNYRIGSVSMLGEIARGRWMLLASFGAGTMITGFFWEMWNFYAFPKWFYTIPHIGFFKVFEMPILGFLGYIPFGLFVFSFTSLAISLSERILKRKFSDYLSDYLHEPIDQ